ncbi:MAG TPA: transposase [Rhodanobacter sp.]
MLTTTTCDRQRLFAAPECARVASRIIRADSTWGDAHLFAWVLMPDHWHGLLQLGNEPLARVMNRFKANVTRALHAACALDERIRDRSFHDHALRANEDVRQAARYVLANPIRAGLVKSTLDYPYWNAFWLAPEHPLS